MAVLGPILMFGASWGSTIAHPCLGVDEACAQTADLPSSISRPTFFNLKSNSWLLNPDSIWHCREWEG